MDRKDDIMIKAKLKELGIKLSELSNDLMISRPTLDVYIDNYDNNLNIPKEKYQIIFDELFNDRIKTKQDFRDVLLTYRNMLQRDMKIGILDVNPEDSDLINSIIEKIRQDIKTNDYDRNIYLFISTLINSYKNDFLFKMISKYILYLNNSISIENIDEKEKIFISNYYGVLHNYKDNELSYNDENYKNFLKRVEEIKNENEKARNEVEDRIQMLISKEIDAKLKLGMKVDDIKIEDIVKQLTMQINQ